MATAVQQQDFTVIHGTQHELPRTGLAALLGQLTVPGEVQLPNGVVVPVRPNSGKPVYKVIFRTQHALQTPMTEMGVGNAFVANEIDVEGDLSVLFSLHSRLRHTVPFIQKMQFMYDFIRPVTQMNSKAIGAHYYHGDDSTVQPAKSAIAFTATHLSFAYRKHRGSIRAQATDDVESSWFKESHKIAGW